MPPIGIPQTSEFSCSFCTIHPVHPSTAPSASGKRRAGVRIPPGQQLKIRQLGFAIPLSTHRFTTNPPGRLGEK